MTKRELKRRLDEARKDNDRLRLEVRDLNTRISLLRSELKETAKQAEQKIAAAVEEMDKLRQKLAERTSLLLEVQEKILWPRVAFDRGADMRERADGDIGPYGEAGKAQTDVTGKEEE